MKKKFLIVFPVLLCAVAVVAALAIGGSSSDPLVSLSYLKGSFTGKINLAVDRKLDTSDQTITANVTAGQNTSSSGSGTAAKWTDVCLKQADVLSGSTGLNVILLAGSVKVTVASGTVVDVTVGKPVRSGTVLVKEHRYLAAENASAKFTVTSKTAVMNYQGPYHLTLSSATDYNAMASALKTMHLFKGTYTGYGNGYDLENATTRLQALIMLTRVLGEENQALAYPAKTPFTDIASGSNAAKYVGYAYAKGYTTGYSGTLFKPSQTVNVYQYTEFILRALGYSSASNTNLSGTLAKAQACGVLTSGEVVMLKSGKFLRAQLVYISYYALNATVSGTNQTLRDKLSSQGVFTASESQKASALVNSKRIA